STVLARVVVGFAAAASVASRQSDVVDVSSCRARRQSYTALRHNGAVKLSGLLGSLVEAGRGSYSTVDGPEHGRARSLPHGRYAEPGTYPCRNCRGVRTSIPPHPETTRRSLSPEITRPAPAAMAHAKNLSSSGSRQTCCGRNSGASTISARSTSSAANVSKSDPP